MNIEKLTVKFMSALRDSPKGQNQWSEKAAHEIAEGLKFSDEEFKSVMGYADRRLLIDMTKRTDGSLRVRFGQNADEWLSRNTESWSLNHRLALWAIIVSIVLGVGAVVAQWLLRD